MVRKVERVKQGDLLGVRSEFKPKAEEPSEQESERPY